MGAGAVVTSMADSGAGAGGGDMFADLGASLSSAYDSATGDAGADESSDPGPGEQPLGDEPPPEPVIADPAADNQPAAAAQPQPGTEPASPFQLSPDGKFYQVPKAQLPQFQTAQKYHEAVGQYFATPQEAQTAHAQAADLRIMANDFMGGSEQGIQQVLRHWAGFDHAGNPAMQQRYQQSFAKMANHMPEILRSVNPQAHEAMQTQFITASIDSAYQHAAQTGNPEDFKAAQERDFGFTGQYKTDISQVAKPQPQMTERERQMQQFDARQDVALRRDVTGFNQTSVEGAKFQQLDASIEKLLAPVKGRYSEVAFADLKAGIRNELVGTLHAKSEFWTEHQQHFGQLMDDYRTTWKQGSPGAGLQPRVQSYIQSFLSQAQRALPSIAQKRIGAATQSAAARASNGQFAAGTPQPQTRNGTPKPPTTPNERRMSNDEFYAQIGDALRIPGM